MPVGIDVHNAGPHLTFPFNKKIDPMKKVLLLLLLPAAVLAQPKKKDDRSLVALAITYEPDQLEEAGQYYLIVEKPQWALVKKGQTFLLKSIWRKEGDKTANIGAGTVSILNDDDMEAKAMMNKGAQVQKGDLAMFLLPLKLPAKKDTLFFKFARLGIGLKTVLDSSFYDRSQMILDPGSYDVSAMIQGMAEDIRYTAKEMIAANDAQDQMIDSGPFKGMRLFDAMLKATDADVFDFLRYVYFFPDKYMAHEWRVSEVYATWLINGAPKVKRKK